MRMFCLSVVAEAEGNPTVAVGVPVDTYMFKTCTYRQEITQ
jgi:hypothetical protein